MRYDKLIAGFVILLVVFSIAVSLRTEKAKQNDFDFNRVRVLEKKVQDLREEQIAIKVKLEGLERTIRDNNVENPRTAQISQEMDDGRYVNENITSDNVLERTIWNQTNKPGVYLVNIVLQKAPNKASLLISTSKGVVPQNSYNLISDTEISIVMQDTMDQFISSGNYIKIRYMPKS